MDPESYEKWKKEVLYERRELMNKAKEFHKETLNRKKAMEMRIQAEIAKEEKRRQEMLAERRANHVEATMRFQKGLKHFRANRSRLTLEQALRAVNPTPSPALEKRISSAENRVIVYNNDFFSGGGLNSLHQENSRFDHFNNNLFDTNNNNNNSNNIKLRRSSSFDTFKNVNNAVIYRQPDMTAAALRPNPIATVPMVAKNNLTFNTMLNENQKNIQHVNKEALKEFQNVLANELNVGMSKQFRVIAEGSHNDSTKMCSESFDSLEQDSLSSDINFDNKPPKKFANKFSGSDNNDFNAQIMPVQNQQLKKYFNNEKELANTSKTTAKKSAEVKSILKRSSSLDGQLSQLSMIGTAAPATSSASQIAHFDPRSTNKLKDSIELANSRLNNRDALNDSARKKSVRFAAKLQSDNNSNVIVDNHETKPADLNVVTQQQEKTTSNPEEQSVLPSRISSTNSIRRPIVKEHLQQQTNKQLLPNNKKPVNESTSVRLVSANNSLLSELSSRLDDKPPFSPSSVANLLLNNNSYSVISQKRKEFMQRNNSGRRVTSSSPKGRQPIIKSTTPDMTAMISPISTNADQAPPSRPIVQPQVYAFQPKSAFAPPVPTTTTLQTNMYQQVNNTAMESQAAKLKIQQNTMPSQNSAINNYYKYKLDVQDMSQQQQQQNNSFTRIPISPKSNILRQNYYNYLSSPNAMLLESSYYTNGNSNNNFKIVSKRALSAHVNNNGGFSSVPAATPIKVPQPSEINNSEHTNNNGHLWATQQHQRVSSADKINPQIRVQNPYQSPLYSYHQSSTNYNNIAKPVAIRPQPNPSQAIRTEPMITTESMRDFIKLEELTNNNSYVEPQIIHNYEHNNSQPKSNHRIAMRMAPVTLSMEEKNVQDSIMRLNERLNALTSAGSRRSQPHRDETRIKKQPQYLF